MFLIFVKNLIKWLNTPRSLTIKFETIDTESQSKKIRHIYRNFLAEARKEVNGTIHLFPTIIAQQKMDSVIRENRIDEEYKRLKRA